MTIQKNIYNSIILYTKTMKTFESQQIINQMYEELMWELEARIKNYNWWDYQVKIIPSKDKRFDSIDFSIHTLWDKNNLWQLFASTYRRNSIFRWSPIFSFWCFYWGGKYLENNPYVFKKWNILSADNLELYAIEDAKNQFRENVLDIISNIRGRKSLSVLPSHNSEKDKTQDLIITLICKLLHDETHSINWQTLAEIFKKSW